MANAEDSTAFVEALTGYTFNDEHIAEEAMKQTRNKRLAFLGDKVVALVLIDPWYRSQRSCGSGTFDLQHYACNEEMARQAMRAHVEQHIQLHPSFPKGAIQSTHGLATDIEAIVGAVWIDSGRNFEVVKDVMGRLNIYPSGT